MLGEPVLHGQAEHVLPGAHGSNTSGPDAPYGQRLKAPHHEALAEHPTLRVQVHLREPLEQHLDNEPAFQARERTALRMVDAASK